MLHPAPQLPDSQKTQARSQRSGASNGAFASQGPLHSSHQQPELDKQQHNHKGRHQREDGVALLTQGGRGMRSAEWPSSYTSTAVAQISSPLLVSIMRGSGRLGGPAKARPSS